MMPVPIHHQAPVPPPSYQRAQAKAGKALHIDAVTLITRLHLFMLCHLAVRLAHRKWPPPEPVGPGGAPRRSSEESLLLVALLRVLWRLSYQDRTDWLQSWLALAFACGFASDSQNRLRVPRPSQQCKRRHAAGAPLFERLFLVSVRIAVRRRVIRAHDLIIESAPILAWRRSDPDATYGHAPAHHPRPLLRGFCVHPLMRALALDFLSNFWFLPQMIMILHLHDHYLRWQYTFTEYVHALFVLMQRTGVASYSLDT